MTRRQRPVHNRKRSERQLLSFAKTACSGENSRIDAGFHFVFVSSFRCRSWAFANAQLVPDGLICCVICVAAVRVLE